MWAVRNSKVFVAQNRLTARIFCFNPQAVLSLRERRKAQHLAELRNAERLTVNRLMRTRDKAVLRIGDLRRNFGERRLLGNDGSPKTNAVTCVKGRSSEVEVLSVSKNAVVALCDYKTLLIKRLISFTVLRTNS